MASSLRPSPEMCAKQTPKRLARPVRTVHLTNLTMIGFVLDDRIYRTGQSAYRIITGMYAGFWHGRVLDAVRRHLDSIFPASCALILAYSFSDICLVQ